MLSERVIKMQKDRCIHFIDYTNVFDKARHSDYLVIENINLREKNRVIGDLYWELIACT